MRMMNLVAGDADSKDKWVRGLRFLVNRRSVEDPVKQEQMWLAECFGKADKNRDHLLDKDEIVHLMKSLNVSSEVFIHSFTHSFIHSFIHSLTSVNDTNYLLTYLPASLLACLFTYFVVCVAQWLSG